MGLQNYSLISTDVEWRWWMSCNKGILSRCSSPPDKGAQSRGLDEVWRCTKRQVKHRHASFVQQMITRRRVPSPLATRQRRWRKFPVSSYKLLFIRKWSPSWSFLGFSSAVRQMPGDLCTTSRIISLSPLSLATGVTDGTLGESGLWLGTRTGISGTAH